MLLTSHELAEVERLADRIAVLAGGRIVASGTPDELAAGLRPRLRFGLDRPLDATELRAGLGARDRRAVIAAAGDGSLRGRRRAPDAGDAGGVGGMVRREGRLIVGSRTVGGTLEDAYLELVGGGGAAQ